MTRKLNKFIKKYKKNHNNLIVIDLYNGERMTKVYVVVEGKVIYPIDVFFIPGAGYGLSDDNTVIAKGIEYYNPFYALRYYKKSIEYLLNKYDGEFEVVPILFSQKNNKILDIYEEVVKIHSFKEFEELLTEKNEVDKKLIEILSNSNLTIDEASKNIHLRSLTKDYKKLAFELLLDGFYGDLWC